MTIWVDADACPAPIRDILFRAARRTGVSMTLVANHALHVPPLPGLSFLQVASGFDAADDEIVARVGKGDLVITADVPLAAAVVERGGVALTPRGERLSAETVRARLNMRDFYDTLRASGIQSRGPTALNAADRQAFANELDRYLARRPGGAT